MKLPQNVRRFAWLWGMSLLLALMEIPLMPPVHDPTGQVIIDQQGFKMFTAIFTGAVFIVLLPFFWLTVWRGQNWARWLLFLLFACSTPLIYVIPTSFHPDHLAMTGMATASVLVEAIGFYFLFTGDAVDWFRSKKQPA